MNDTEALEKLEAALPAEPPTSRFKPYPAYKESGVEWLGQVPAHWDIKRLRFVAQINPSKSEIRNLLSDATVNFLPMEMIGEGFLHSADETRRLEDVSTGYTYFRNRDIIVAKITPCFENGKGAIINNLSCGIGFGTTELFVIRPDNKLLPEFVHFVTQTQLFRRSGTALMEGAAGQKRITAEFIRDFPVPSLGLDEQKQITAFLDRETAKIDTLIAKKQQLIELLKEKRTALITHAVTKGLNPSAPMKPSSIDWLGDIPGHWEVAPLMRLTQTDRPIMYGIVLPGPNAQEGVPIVKGGDVKPDRLKLESLCRTTFEIEASYARSRLRGGDLVYAIRGSIGDVEAVPEEISGANLTQDAARVAAKNSVCVQWLKYALRSQSTYQQLEAGSLGATIRGINIRDLKRAKVPVPPEPEQHAISSYISFQLKRTDRLIGRVEAHIEKLREYRSALITAAVTGKIDVRAATPSQSTIAAAS